MPGRLEGKVAFITGAARGQGRSHAVRLAQEGADIIAIDIVEQIESNPYPLSTPEDLAETVTLVEKLGRRIIATKADVRERDQLREAVNKGVAELGRLDIVVANAGILPMAMGDPQATDFIDAVDVDLIGVLNAVAVSVPHLPDRSSIIVTGSTAAMLPNTTDNPAMGPGSAGYGWSKKILIGYVEEMALHLASKFIRVNAIHPTNVNTHLLHNDGLYAQFRP
ncbi:SDR family NAD(P)-dependent oxidoreductase, partial [Frankia sp. CpI1-P]